MLARMKLSQPFRLEPESFGPARALMTCVTLGFCGKWVWPISTEAISTGRKSISHHYKTLTGQRLTHTINQIY
jgi:hypothetical protein